MASGDFGPVRFVIGDRELERVPSDQSPNWCAGYGAVGRFMVVGASTIGRSHASSGKPRDDAFVARSDGQRLAVAVADGAGSRPMSRFGAALCAERLCRHLLCLAGTSISDQGEDGLQDYGLDPPELRPPSAAALANEAALDVARYERTIERILQRAASCSSGSDPPGAHAATFTWARATDLHTPGRSASRGIDAPAVMRAAFRSTRKDLERFASRRANKNGLDIHDLSCTLLGILLDARTGCGAGGQIGDGGIVLIDPVHGPRRLLEPDAPRQPNATYAMSHPQWESHLVVAGIETEPGAHAPSVLMMSDGVADDHLFPPPDDVLTRSCQDIHRQLGGIEPELATAKLLHWLATYTVPGSFDDRTLAAAMAEVNPDTGGATPSEPSDGPARAMRHVDTSDVMKADP